MEKRNFVSDLHLACAKDDLRPVMQCVHFINGYAYASDGHIVIKQSLEYSDVIGLEILDNKAIHADSFKEIRKYQDVEVMEDGFNCTAKNGRMAFFPFKEFEEDAKVPDFNTLFPSGITHIGEIGIAPKLVGHLDKLMAGGAIVRMSFSGVDRGVVFHSVNEEYCDQKVMIIPNRLSND